MCQASAGATRRHPHALGAGAPNGWRKEGLRSVAHRWERRARLDHHLRMGPQRLGGPAGDGVRRVGDHAGYAYAADRPTVLSDPSGLFWGKVLDWFNEHINPGYAFLQGCFGSGASTGHCALASVGLAVTAVGLGGLATKVAGIGEVG